MISAARDGMSCSRSRTPRGRRSCISIVKDLTTYLPRYLKRRRHARRVDIVAAPLFPRYLFVAIDMTDAALAFNLFDHRRLELGRHGDAPFARCRAGGR